MNFEVTAVSKHEAKISFVETYTLNLISWFISILEDSQNLEFQMFTLFTCHHLGGPNNMANAHALNLEKYLLYLSFLLRDLFHCMIFDFIFYCVTITQSVVKRGRVTLAWIHCAGIPRNSTAGTFFVDSLLYTSSAWSILTFSGRQITR